MSQTESYRVARGRQYDILNKEYLQNKPPTDFYEYNWRDRPFTHAIVLHPNDPGWKRTDGRKNKVLSQAEWRLWLQRDYDLKKSQYQPENNEAQNDFQIQTRRYNNSILSATESAKQNDDSKEGRIFNSKLYQDNNSQPHVEGIHTYYNRYDPVTQRSEDGEQRSLAGASRATQQRPVSGNARYSGRYPDDDSDYYRYKTVPEPYLFHTQQRIRAPRVNDTGDFGIQDLQFQNRNSRQQYSDLDTPCVETFGPRLDNQSYRNHYSTPSYLSYEPKPGAWNTQRPSGSTDGHHKRRHHHHHYHEHPDRYSRSDRYDRAPSQSYVRDEPYARRSSSAYGQGDYSFNDGSACPCMCPYFNELLMLDNAYMSYNCMPGGNSYAQQTLVYQRNSVNQRQAQDCTPDPIQNIYEQNGQMTGDVRPIGRTRSGIVV